MPPFGKPTPTGRWLAWLSIILVVHTFIVGNDIEVQYKSVPVTLLVMSVSLAFTAIPLLVYVHYNGLPALHAIKGRLILLCILISAKTAWEICILLDVPFAIS